MNMVYAAFAFAAVLSLTAAPLTADVFNISFNEAGIEMLTLPEGYYPLTKDGREYSQDAFGGEAHAEVCERYFSKDTVAAFVNSDGKRVIRIDSEAAENSADYSELNGAETEKILSEAVRGLEKSDFSVYDSGILNLNGARYIAARCGREEENDRTELIVYQTVKNGKSYRISAESDGNALSEMCRNDMFFLTESIVWGDTVTDAVLSRRYSDPQAGIFFSVPSGWEQAGDSEHSAEFYCGDGEYLTFDSAPEDDMFSGKNESGAMDVAELLGCGEEEIMETAVNGQEYLNALLFSDKTYYHIFTVKNGAAYHFTYISPGEERHADEFMALISSVDFAEPIAAAPSETPEPSAPKPVETKPTAAEHKPEADRDETAYEKHEESKNQPGAAVIIILSICAVAVPFAVLRFAVLRRPLKSRRMAAFAAVGWYAACVAAQAFIPAARPFWPYSAAAMILPGALNFLMITDITEISIISMRVKIWLLKRRF